jgi:hypothetical protein
MARRDWGVLKGEDGTVPGDPDSISRAMALGNRFDATTIESVHDALVAMDKFGGQLMIQVRRSKYDASGSEIPPSLHRETPGQWVTDGFVFSYESRDRNLKEITPPDAVELEEVDTFIETEADAAPAEEEAAA